MLLITLNPSIINNKPNGKVVVLLIIIVIVN